jgi:hypothetical protein
MTHEGSKPVRKAKVEMLECQFNRFIMYDDETPHEMFNRLKNLVNKARVRESPRLWLTLESLYCPLLYGDLIVEIELDLSDHSKWIRVERDLALCELHNGDVGILYGCSNFGKKFCVFVCLILIHFMFLLKLCFCLELDLTLDLNP